MKIVNFINEVLAWMILVSLGVLVIISGCEKHTKSPSGPPPTVAVPVEVTPADATPIKQSVKKALTSATKAEAGLTDALSNPVGPETVGKVSTARNDVGETKTELINANDNVIPKLERDLASETANRHLAEAALRTNTENAAKAAAERDDIIKKRDEEIVKLKDAELTHFKHMLYGIALILALLGACSLACQMYFGFAFGWKLSAICGIMSAILFTFAAMVDTIIQWVTYAGIGALIIGTGWTLYHYFHHDTALTQAAIDARNPLAVQDKAMADAANANKVG